MLVCTLANRMFLTRFSYRRFVSFCRVGTGLSDEEIEAVATKLKPYLRYFVLLYDLKTL